MDIFEKAKKLKNYEKKATLKLAVGILETHGFDGDFEDEKNCAITDLVSLTRNIPA